MKLNGRVAVVTGAANGIGRELALRLHREGCHLALCDVDEEALAQVKQSCEEQTSCLGKVAIKKVDLSDRSQIRDFVDFVVREHGDTVHTLFNNAGLHRIGSFDTMSTETFDHVMAVDLDAVVFLTHKLWPHLMRADEAAVVNISSVAGFWPPGGVRCLPYVTAKYAVRGFSEGLAYECRFNAPHITVHVVHPGAIDTNIGVTGMQHLNAKDALDTRYLQLPRSMSGRLEGLSEDEMRSGFKKYLSKFFKTFGMTPKAAADIIVSGVLRGKPRILIGWDAFFIDKFVRLFPTIHLSLAGDALVGFVSIILPTYFQSAAIAVASVLAIAAAYMSLL